MFSTVAAITFADFVAMFSVVASLPFSNFVAMFSVVTFIPFANFLAMFSVVAFPLFADFFAMFSAVAARTFFVPFAVTLVAKFAVAVLPVESFSTLLADHDATCARHQMAIVAPMANPQMKPPAR